MTIAPKNTNDNRRRRAHKKSRRGCSSCKLRRVKCDERKPNCQNCKHFGLTCTYESKSGLVFAGEGSFRLEGCAAVKAPLEDAGFCPDEGEQVASKPSSLVFSRESPTRLPKPRALNEASLILANYNHARSSSLLEREDFSFGIPELGILQKFNERTVLSVGTAHAANIYQREIFQLACTHSFLEHIVVTLTLLHDRHLAGEMHISRQILKHWHQGTAKFVDALTKPIRDEDKDALWATAALLGAIQFASFDARTPEEAWPLKPFEDTDLDWLRMSHGKKAVFAIADPLRPDSVFCNISNGHGAIFRPMMESHLCSRDDLVELTRDFSDMFGLGPESTGAKNPYHKAAMTLARLLHVPCDRNNIIEFFGFMMHLGPEMKGLIEVKDPKALLMVAYWYAKLHKGQWWLNRRGLIEGQAICMYLDRFHGGDVRLRRMLRWPKTEFGLLQGPVEYALKGSQWSSSAATVLCVV